MRRRRGRPRLHDWNQLFHRPPGSDSHEVTYRQGVDFVCQVSSFIVQIRNQASARQMSVIVQRDGNNVRAVVV